MKKLLVILLVLGLAAPAMASDWYFYGSARTHLGYYMVDEDFATGPATDPSIGSNGLDDDSGTTLNLYGQSRFGGKAVVSDNFSGGFEFGLRETGTGGEEEAVYLRLIYGTWNFGAGKLMVGKHYTPATFLGYSGMGADLGDNGDANMLVAGLAYIGRQPQIRLSFGSFDIALIQPNTSANDLGAGDIDFTFPRIEAAYVFKTPVVSIRPIAAFQTYKAEDQTTGDDETIMSYTLGLGVSATLGPAYIKATFSYLQNPGNYGDTNLLVLDALRVGAGNAQFINGDVEDAEEMQGTFVVGVKLNKAFGLEAGVGYGSLEQDVAVLGGATVKQTGFVYYLQAPIGLAKGVTLIPEIGMMDRDDYEIGGVDVPAGDMTYVDVNFRVDF